MAGVDRGQMERTLEALRSAGVLRAWHRRPLGIYWLFLGDGRKITPDTKETAMWAMGASAAMLSHESSSAPVHDPGSVKQALDDLRESGVLDSWSIDADGDYEFRARNERFWVRPGEIRGFTLGALVSEQAKQHPDMDPDQVREVLDGLRTIGALDYWRIDEAGNYEMFAPGNEHFTLEPWRIGAFMSGAIAVYRAGTASDDSHV